MATILATPLDVETFVLEQGHGVKGLSELNLKTLPKKYIQPVEERHDPNLILRDEYIPVIDMSEWDNPQVAELICNAAETLGFFLIINHGVSFQVIKDVKSATYQFFGLPAEAKRKYIKDVSPSNNVRYGTSFTPKAEKALEWKDYLSCFYVSDDEALALWPSVCRNQLLEYMDKCDSVIKKLLEVLMKRLNVQLDIDKAKQSLLMGSKRINLNYYPICPNPELAIGVGRHSDISTLTILLQDEAGGLYVRKLETDSWIHVPPINGSLIINVGDALQIMSNGIYRSVEHRVVANGSTNRISVPIFVNPRPTDVIGPLPEVLKGGDKAIYKHVLYSDYVKYFFGKGHDGKDTIQFARIDLMDVIET